MSSLADIDIVTGARSAARPGGLRESRGRGEPPDPWLRIGPEGVMTLPLPGQPGHGRKASLRRQPARIVEGRMEGGYTSAFELICPSCGDHPYLDYSVVPPQLQRLRGPRTLQAGLAAYDEHLGLLPRPHEDRTGSPDASGPRNVRGPRPGTDTTTIPAAGEPGHGLGAILRRRAVAGIMQWPTEGDHPALFELICYDCGDDPGLAYGEIAPRLQWLRGPRPMATAWAAYERHLGLGLTGRG
jgi:hypothetical protein